MSFSTYVKTEFEMKHISKDDLKSTAESLKEAADDIWCRLQSLAVMTPAPQKGACEVEWNWLDYVEQEIRHLREELEDIEYRRTEISLALTAQMLDKDAVHDDNDEWDEEHQCWKEDK